MLTRKLRTFIQQLRHKKFRQAHQCFVVEGYTSTNEFLQANYIPQWLLVTPHFLEKHPHSVSPHAAVMREVTPETLAHLGSFTANRDILAVFHYKTPPPLSWDTATKILVLDNLQDPGNLGTIIRLADWYGISSVVASPTTVDCYNPKVIQASMGSLAHIIPYYLPLEAFLQEAQAKNLPVMGALLQGKNLHTHPLPAAACLVIGNETHGISAPLLPHLSLAITIPRFGRAKSLNAAMAASILCDRWCASTPL